VSDLRAPRVLRIRHAADAPPAPMGCRWCGHAVYAHDDAGALPGRPHRWEHPTSRQMAARIAVRRRLGLCGIFPPAAPTRPSRVHPPARMGRQATAAAPGRGRSPDTPPRSRRQASRSGAAA
jgi:hypothetical protein